MVKKVMVFTASIIGSFGALFTNGDRFGLGYSRD